MIRNNRRRHGKAQPGSAGFSFCGKKGILDFSKILGRDADSLIAYLHSHNLLLLVEMGRDFDTAVPVAKRLTGVLDQVYDDLFELLKIAGYLWYRLQLRRKTIGSFFDHVGEQR